ncbi:MAG: zinc ribbon domain-containing protein [Lachnospiraceae bacterium]|nr:zinc ribbon domain-containing protein [Lachnospiraceae bacterium]
MKECVNCGTQLNDDEYYCEACGNFQPDDRSSGGMNGSYYEAETVKPLHKPEEKMIEIDMEADEPIDSFNPVSNNSNTYGGYAGNNYDYDTPVTYNNKSNKPVKIVFAVAFVVILLIAGIVIKDKVIKDPRTAAEYYLDSICDMDGEKMLDAMAGGEKASSKEVEQMEALCTLVEMYLEKYEISYTIKSVKELSDSEEDVFWNTVKENEVFTTKNKVKKMAVCKVNVKVKDKETFISQETNNELYVGTYKGKWKVVGVKTSDNLK